MTRHPLPARGSVWASNDGRDKRANHNQRRVVESYNETRVYFVGSPAGVKRDSRGWPARHTWIRDTA